MPEPTKRDWFVAAVTFLAGVLFNALLLGYSYGELTQRVQALEKHDEQLREDWKDARERIEESLKAPTK